MEFPVDKLASLVDSVVFAIAPEDSWGAVSVDEETGSWVLGVVSSNAE